MNETRGFTLVELLAAMVVSLILIGTLSWVVSGLVRSSRISEREARVARFATVGATLDNMLRAAIIPAKSERDLPRRERAMSFLVPPPAALGNVGPLRLDLSVRRTAEGEALASRFSSTLPWIALPEPAARETVLLSGFRSIRFAYDEVPDRVLPTLVTMTFVDRDGITRRMAIRPLVSIGTDCVFDPISLACRPT